MMKKGKIAPQRVSILDLIALFPLVFPYSITLYLFRQSIAPSVEPHMAYEKTISQRSILGHAVVVHS